MATFPQRFEKKPVRHPKKGKYYDQHNPDYSHYIQCRHSLVSPIFVPIDFVLGLPINTPTFSIIISRIADRSPKAVVLYVIFPAVMTKAMTRKHDTGVTHDQCQQRCQDETVTTPWRTGATIVVVVVLPVFDLVVLQFFSRRYFRLSTLVDSIFFFGRSDDMPGTSLIIW